LHEPETIEGWQLWDLTKRLAGQLRPAGLGGLIGLDLGVALQMGSALGIPAFLVAEIMPEIEGAMIAAIRDRTAGAENDG
jgi:hypothetical protein